MKYLKILIFCWLLVCLVPGYAEENESAENNKINSWQHLDTLVTLIDSMDERLRELRKEMQKSKGVGDQEIVEEIEQTSLDLQSLNTALEMLATGGADLSLFGEKKEQKFNWRDQLESVFEPILVELRRISERPRKIERLRSDQAYFEERLAIAESAVQSLSEYQKTAPSDQLKNAFSPIEDRWTRRRDDFKSRLDLVKFELQETLSPTNAPKTDPVESLKKLLGGRVLNLVIALAVMGAVYVGLNTLANTYRRYVSGRRSKRRKAFLVRAGTLVFYLFTTLIVLLSGMAVFYVRGDWVLMGLVFIMLAGAAWAVQKSLPQFVTEAKLILNLGPVREGERIIFKDLPWLVESLSFQAILVNPLLQGGSMQVPVKTLVEYNSRRSDESEIWFPTRKDDWALLDDETFGQVVSQSPEFVEFKVFDAIKTYRSTAFIDQNPRNLSMNGFTLFMTFGLDYKHQENILTTIEKEMQGFIEAGFQHSGLENDIESLKLEFESASASSLDLVTQIRFSGAAAESYHAIPRLLQRLAVGACNKHGWVIPFNQITVHTV